MSVLSDIERQALRDALDDEHRAWATRLPRSTHREDILAVFGNLLRASQERHLQAFRRCASRGAGRGTGPRRLRGWARELAGALERLGAKVFPSEAYFFVATGRGRPRSTPAQAPDP